MKKNFCFFVGILLVVALVAILQSIIGELTDKEISLGLYSILWAVSIAFLVLSIVMDMGLIRISLRFCDQEKGRFSELFNCYPLFFRYFIGSILYGLIVLGGLVLLIIPGIIWAIKFQFFGYFIVDKKTGPIEALKRSAAITKGAKRNLFLFAILLGFINILGALFFIVGLFATIPTTMVALAFVYRKLLSHSQAEQGHIE